jgi:hypothetical protein
MVVDLLVVATGSPRLTTSVSPLSDTPLSVFPGDLRLAE